VLQDIIAVRCNYVASIDLKVVFFKTAELADKVFTISSYTHSDFKAFFGEDVAAHVIHHGTNLGLSAAESLSGEHILLVGNSYTHKAVKDALPHLLGLGSIAVLGGERPEESLPAEVIWHTSGRLTRGHIRELFGRARVLVYPSHYEGYGLPIVDALALGKHVVGIETEVNHELASSLNDPNLTLIRSLHELRRTVASLLEKSDAIGKRPAHTRRWRAAAEEYVVALRELLRQPPNGRNMRARNELFRVLDSSRHP
jgi:glycosyltransferase involved in cell wall biosynthesis